MVKITLDQTRSKLLVSPQFYDEAVLGKMSLVTGKVWNKKFKAWTIPFTHESLTEIHQLLSQVTTVNVDPSLYHKIREEKKQEELVLESKTVDNVELPVDLKFTTEPFKHQKQALKLCLDNRKFALFMEMGTGKTKVILDALGYIKTFPALIVCPVSVMHNWKNETKKHQPHLNVAVLNGGKQEKIDKLKVLGASVDIVVINYESAWRIYEHLNLVDWGTVVLDEATRIKHRASQQAKGILKLGIDVKNKYILTGTPSPNSPLELFNQIRFLNPNIFGHNWYAFRDRYAIMGGYGGYKIIGWKNLEELSRKIAAISFRALKRDCLDLPDKIYKEFRIDMDDDQRRIYKEMAEDFVTTVSNIDVQATVALAKLTKLRQIASGFLYLPDGSSHKIGKNPKLEKLAEILEDNIKTHKFVIWTNFTQEIEIISHLLEALKINFVKLDGTVEQTKRGEIIDTFQNDPTYRVFLSNQKAGGIGINLTAADYCVFYSNDYSPEVRLQAEDRLHRIGQTNKVTYIDLIMKATVDSTILRMLTNKQDLSSKIMSGNAKEAAYGDEPEF